MTEEFNLSEKRNQICDKGRVFYWEEDVKEFIRRLKDKIINWEYCAIEPIYLITFIDKLAGEKLTK